MRQGGGIMRHSHSSEQNPPKLSKSGTISTANAESVASRLLAPHEYTSINSTTHAGICNSATAVLSSFVTDYTSSLRIRISICGALFDVSKTQALVPGEYGSSSAECTGGERVMRSFLPL